MRGNHGGLYLLSFREGSIPAYAGEPMNSPAPKPTSPVYPRVCGGTTVDLYHGYISKGLSPRMRGNLYSAGSGDSGAGSIPAYAGEP